MTGRSTACCWSSSAGAAATVDRDTDASPLKGFGATLFRCAQSAIGGRLCPSCMPGRVKTAQMRASAIALGNFTPITIGDSTVSVGGQSGIATLGTHRWDGIQRICIAFVKVREERELGDC